MAKDKQGNDLANVGVPITGAICIVPYSEDNVITRTMISKKNATPKLPEVYARSTAALGLIANDGAPQDSTETGDPIEFWQGGYTLNGDTTIYTAFTTAEDNDLTRELCFGEKPDADGVIAVDTFTPDTKWMAYEEITYKERQRRPPRRRHPGDRQRAGSGRARFRPRSRRHRQVGARRPLRGQGLHRGSLHSRRRTATAAAAAAGKNS